MSRHVLTSLCLHVSMSLHYISHTRQWKLQRERLQADFTRALDNFQRAQRSAAQKEKEAIKKYKNTAGGQTDLIDIEAAGGGGGGRTQMMLQEEQQNLEHLIERERAVTQLEADIMDVNQIFKDLAAMVHDQGELVDSIEANVETSSIRVSEGTEQLRQAERYQVRVVTVSVSLHLLVFRIRPGRRR